MKMAKKRMVYTFIVSIIVVFSTTFAILMTLERTDYRNYLQGEYSKSMYQLITSVQNIGVDLGKAAVSGSKEQSIITFEEIFRSSTIANDKLHSLPLPQDTISSTSKFLSQVGDFCYSQVRATSEGRELSNSEFEAIDKLKTQSSELLNKLNLVLEDINRGKVKWAEIRKKAVGVLGQGTDNSIPEKFQNIQKQVAQYPALIYDGPFSDNVLNIKPRVGKLSEVSKNQSNEVIMKALGDGKQYNIVTNESKDKYGLNTYSYVIESKDKKQKDKAIYADVTKNGGQIIYLINNRNLGNPKIDKDNAFKKGIEYLEKLGYKSMVPMYSLKYENSMVVSYVYKQNNVIIYPDQIKLKIALDNGEIIGVEAQKYLFSHLSDRKLNTSKITEVEARKKLSKRVTVHNTKLTVIPTETDKEILCYEFSCTYNKDEFLIYINAENGYEQRILQIFNTPNGEMTM